MKMYLVFTNMENENNNFNLRREEVIKKYDDFLMNIESNILKIKMLLGVQKLTHSMQEIDDLDNLFLDFCDKYYKKKQFFTFLKTKNIPLSKNEFQKILYVYLCETWIFHFGGNYNLNLDENTVSYGYPEIIKNDNSLITFFGWIKCENKKSHQNLSQVF